MFYLIDHLTDEKYEIYHLRYFGRNISGISYIISNVGGEIELEELNNPQFIKCLPSTKNKRYEIVVQE